MPDQIDTFIDDMMKDYKPSIQEAFIINALVAEGIKKDIPKDDSIISLELPPMNEAEFFAKILWGVLYPNEPTNDPYFVEVVTKIIYNIADIGKLHKALQDWIADKLVENGKAKDTSSAENMASSLLDESESYDDLLNAIGQPKAQKKKEPNT